MKKDTINWKLYFILLAVSILTTTASLPYAFTLAGGTLKQIAIPLPELIAISLIQSSVIFAIFLFLGLRLSSKIGLGLPIIEAFLSHDDNQSVFTKSIAGFSVLIGIVTGVIIIVSDFLFARAGVQINLWTGNLPPFWMGFLASFYGAVGEEILLRLFFMSFLAWAFSRGKAAQQNIPGNGYIMWSAIAIAALLFGLAHLPITATITTLTPLVIARAIFLNGIGGVAFGWLYWKKGLESAMIAHFMTDILLHVVLPLILSIFKGTA